MGQKSQRGDTSFANLRWRVRSPCGPPPVLQIFSVKEVHHTRITQLGRVPVLQTGSRGFDPRSGYQRQAEMQYIRSARKAPPICEAGLKLDRENETC